MSKKTTLKSAALLLMCGMIAFSSTALGQKNDSTAAIEKQRREMESLETSSRLNPASIALHQRLSNTVVENERISFIQEAVRAGDRSVVPYLKARLEGGFGPANYLDVGLVALGESSYVDKAIEELKSNNYVVQVDAIWKLTRFKTKESYRKLYDLLDDMTNRDPDPNDDALYRPLAYVVMDELSSTVENPPKGKGSNDAAAWKAWFARNKQLIE
jgi:hypothetical protein